MAISKNKFDLNLDWVDIIILHPPGSGGDMFRTLLMMAITPNKYELGEFNYYGNKTGLLVDGKGLVWIDDVGQCCNILQYLKDTDQELSEKYPKEVRRFIERVEKSHYIFPEIKYFPTQIYITTEDWKYWEWVKKTWEYKMKPASLKKWTDDYNIFTKEDLQKHNELIKDNYKVYIDNFFEWDKINTQLVSIINYYEFRIYPNWVPMKQFWQAWIDEQRIKVE